MADLSEGLTAVLADRYAIQRELGRGGMATVYLARDSKHGRQVAIKVLRPELAASLGAERFVREIEIAASLTHPHILPLFDSGEADGFLYYVMPYVEGESLRDRLDREKQLPLEDALDIAREVADALGHAHALGIVHRDIKPENILFQGGHALVADFGIARAVSAAGVAPLTETGLAVGTPAYMSPEQGAGSGEVDARSDIYSLACVLYEMLSGETPYLGATPQAIVAKKLSEPPPRVSVVRDTVPPGVERAVRRALARTPADRFATVARFVEALAAGPQEEAPAAASIVVLPFENLSPDPEQAYFADGMTEELIADLSKIRALRVISRTSAMLLKGSKKGVPAIAGELGVRYVLEGSVRRAGPQLRITAQLIEAATDAHLWAEKYTGTLEDVFDLQEQLSRRIVEALRVTLAPEEDRHLAGRDIPDVEAYALYVRARQEFQKMTRESFDLAERLLDRALARTGPNALLLAAAAELQYGFQDMGYRPAAETLDRGDALATRALELDPDLAEAHVAKALIAQRRFDVPTTVCHVRRAVELDPGNAMAAWAAGFVLAEVGCTDEARAHGDRARALDPLWWPAQFGSCAADLFDGDFDTALAKVVRMHTVSGGNPVADLWLGVCLVYAGRSDEVVAPLDRAAAGGVGIFSAAAACVLGMVSENRDAVRTVLADPGTHEALEMVTELTWLVAAASAGVGDLDEAVYWLSRAIEMGFVNHRFFAEVDPFLATLRGDPRFDQLMERARAKQREIETAVPV